MLESFFFCRRCLYRDIGQIPYYKPRNTRTSNFNRSAPRNGFWAKFHITSRVIQDHRTFFSTLQKNYSAQISHYKPRNAGTSKLYQFAPKNLFRAKFHITSQGMQENRTFISSLLKIYCLPNSTLQAEQCRIFVPLSDRSQK